ncbi:PepSY domain-containing protein [Halobacillus hunanensis]|uniref:PepSY domain-containing protein n=1 Tax=Halobacillus hunanensis TaxID=578214 RepID=UPI0015913909|nr:PepSY domain-containing protein [Halobacillus hunanensis]
MNKKVTRILLSLGVLILLIVLMWQVVQSVTSAEPLSMDKARQLIKNQYSGKIVQTEEINDEFIFTIERDTGEYQIRVDKSTSKINDMERLTTKQLESTESKIRKQIEKEYKGEITSLKESKEGNQLQYEVEIKLEDKKVKLTMTETGDVIQEQTVTENDQNTSQEQLPQKANPPITKEQAQKLALKQVSGTIEDVEYEEENGQFFYLIDIENDDETEATVQINAITGEIKLSWDD